MAYIGTLLLFLFTVLAAWLAQPLWLLIPIGGIIVVLLLQQPAVLFYLLLLSIPWSTEYIFPSGIGTDLPDEPLMLLTAFVTLLLLIAQRKKLTTYIIHPLLLIVAIQFGWIIISSLASTHFVLSAKYLLAKSWYLLAFIAAPLLLWRDVLIFKRSVIMLCASMLFVTAVTVIRHSQSGFAFSQINDALAPFFRNHVNYSALLVFMVPIQIFFWKNAKSKKVQLLIASSLLITLPALYFSYARGAWLALLTGSCAYWLLHKRWLLTSYIIAFVLVAASIFWLSNNNRYVAFAHNYQTTVFHENFGEHLAATYQFKDMSTAERFYRWIAGVRMAEDGWQTGFGPSTFYQHYKKYTVPIFKTWVSSNREQSTVHNYFLLLLVEQGVIGISLFLLLIGVAFWYAQKIYHRTTNILWKRAVAAVSVILVMQCTLNFLSDLIETDKVGSVFYLCIAALVIIDRKARTKTNYTN